MTCCTLNTWILTYKLLTSLCPVALFLSMVRSKQGTQTPRFLKCYSAVLLFPVKIGSQILQALQFTWHNEDKLLGRNPEVLENWISGSSKKEKTTPQNSKSNNSIYWSYPMRVNGLTWLSNAAALWCVWTVTRSFAATRAQQPVPEIRTDGSWIIYLA